MKPVDWEERLSQWIGDIPAHQLFKLVRFLSQRGQAFNQNWVDYLQEEVRYLPTRIEVECFFQEVKQLEREVRELEQKITKLKI